jgi:hypothetical protein
MLLSQNCDALADLTTCWLASQLAAHREQLLSPREVRFAAVDHQEFQAMAPTPWLVGSAPLLESSL